MYNLSDRIQRKRENSNQMVSLEEVVKHTYDIRIRALSSAVPV